MERMTQCDRIVDYINRFGSITSKDAFNDLGIVRLASRICDLTKQGYEFDKEFESSKNRFGETTSYIRYKFKKVS